MQKLKTEFLCNERCRFMNYHDIKHDDMLNGDGIRVVLFVSGCEHRCYGCQNPETHSLSSGIPFDEAAENEIFEELDKSYIDGITFSGGDPLHPRNLPEIEKLVGKIRSRYGDNKSIWIYTGYEYINIKDNNLYRYILSAIDVLVDGKFYLKLADVNAPWVGSTNQKVIKLKGLKEKNEYKNNR